MRLPKDLAISHLAHAMAPTTAREFLPARRDLASLRRAAETCRGCDLYKRAKQTVFGAGPSTARVILIGEQPGDQEDIAGKPFVGPAGNLLDKALDLAGIDRQQIYVTNAVKHFKWVPRGKRRLHSKPSAREMAACRPWLEAEFAAIEPEIIVCLGATAAQSLLGRAFRVTRQRGEILEGQFAAAILATYHPSAILRAPDEKARHEMYETLVADLRVVAKRLGANSHPSTRRRGRQPG